jgi:hypothetical protein
MATDTHLRCLSCGTVWLRADNPDTLNSYLQHPCQQNTRNLHPSQMEPR